MQSSISLPPTDTPLMFNDNLLLPRLSNSCRVSPKINHDNHIEYISKKPWTAPTSPINPYRYNNNKSYNAYGNLATPQSSPTFPESSLPLHLPELNGNINNNNNNNNGNGIILPSLRHLQLLPDPRVQEYSYIYPDTSERTSIWKNTLLSWCKNENYHDYVSIRQQPLENHQLKRLESPIPSILNCKDPFYGLSNKPWEFQSPVTPPMSPKRVSPPLMNNNNNNNNTDSIALERNNSSLTPPPTKHDKFTPVISDKLVQCVKKQKVAKPTTTFNSTTNTHKKTNSFKALQIKKMLMDRDVLSINSKRNSRQGHLVLRLSVDHNNYTPTSSNNGSNNTLLSSPTLSPKRSRSTSPRRNSTTKTTERSRSRSRSPVRIVNLTTTTPPQQINNERQNSTSSLPRYHKFSLSGSTSPILLPQASTTTTLIKTNSLHSTQSSNKKNGPRSYSAPTSTNTSPRRDKGMHHHHHHPHGALRKCVSCDSQDSPCWRPSWSKRRQDQLCNSCGLRYKKTKTRCLNMQCKKIPTKGELNIMKSQGKISGPVANNPDIIGLVVGYRCLFCNSITETMD